MLSSPFPMAAGAAAFIALALVPLQSQAVILADYNFGTTAGATTFPTASVDADSNSTASGLVLGAGFPLTGSGTNSGISSSSGNPANSLFLRQTDNSTEAFAFSANKYFTLTITPTGSDPLSIESFSFDYRRDSAAAGEFFFVRTNADGDNFATTIFAGELTAAPTTGSFSSTGTLDLSGAAGLQNIASGTPVTLRIYFYGAVENSAITRLDNLQFNGSYIPESGAGLLGLAGLGVLASLRRRRSR